MRGGTSSPRPDRSPSALIVNYTTSIALVSTRLITPELHTVPTSVNMGASIAQENSRKSFCQKSPIAGSSISRTPGPCFAQSNINDSERTLVDAMETDNKPAYGPDGQRQRQLSSFSASSDEGQAQIMDNTKYQGSIKRRVDYCVVEDGQVAVELGNYTGVWAGDTGESVPQVRSRYFGDHIHQNAYHQHKS